MSPAYSIEDAVLTAINFFEKLYKDKGLRDVLLEEVRERDENTWEVTIGHSRLVQDGPPLAALTHGPKYERVYKTLLVNKATGQVTSMTLRSV